MPLQLVKKGEKKQRIVKIPKPRFVKTEVDTGAYQRLTDRYYTEDMLLDFLGIDKYILMMLRYQRGLPFITIYKGCRLYRAESLFKWLNSQEVTLGMIVEDYESMEEMDNKD